jgi:hypothetical protein
MFSEALATKNQKIRIRPPATANWANQSRTRAS